jgi:shikimate kinase
LHTVGVIWVSGLPGSGRSSVATWLAAKVDRSVYIDGDALAKRVTHGNAISELVVKGGNTRSVQDGEDVLVFDRLRYKNSCLLADSFAEAGFEVIVELVIARHTLREEVLPRLRTRPLYLVQLVTSDEAAGPGQQTEILERLQRRRERFRSETSPDGLWLDTSEHTAVRVAQQILANLGEALVEA